MREVVVLRPGALGDAVTALPVLAAARAAAPGARLTVVGGPLFRLAVACGLADERLGFDDARLLPLFGGGGHCDPVAGADLCLAYGRGDGTDLADAARRCGARQAKGWPAAPPGGVHIVDHLLGAVEALGWSAATRTPCLRPQPGWLADADALLAQRGLGAGYAALHPGSGGRRKRWPAERFLGLARRLGRPVLWLLGPAEAEEPRLAATLEGAGEVVLCPPLETLAGLLARCAVYVGNDSGVSHLAAAVGAPTVAIFGATDPATWAPRGQRVAVLGDPQSGGLAAVGEEQVLAAVEGVAPG